MKLLRVARCVTFEKLLTIVKRDEGSADAGAGDLADAPRPRLDEIENVKHAEKCGAGGGAGRRPEAEDGPRRGAATEAHTPHTHRSGSGLETMKVMTYIALEHGRLYSRLYVLHARRLASCRFFHVWVNITNSRPVRRGLYSPALDAGEAACVRTMRACSWACVIQSSLRRGASWSWPTRRAGQISRV